MKVKPPSARLYVLLADFTGLKYDAVKAPERATHW